MVSQARSGSNAGDGGFLSVGAPSSANCGVARGIEPMIVHLKTNGHLGRCHFNGREGDAANVILTAAGHNFQPCIVLCRSMLARESEGAVIQQVTCDQRAGAGSCDALVPEG